MPIPGSGMLLPAKAANMPNDNIQEYKKAAGELGSVNYEEVTYEGYGANGVALIVEALTDNRNRTASDMRHIFDRAGGSLGATGCVSWMFDRKGLLVLEKNENIDEDELMMLALDAGAEDISDEDVLLNHNSTFRFYRSEDSRKCRIFFCISRDSHDSQIMLMLTRLPRR